MRIMVLSVVLVALVLVCCNAVFSQQRTIDPTTAGDIFQRLNEIEAKIDKFAAGRSDDSAKQVLNKLDQILENQRKVERELEIIRVRVSR